MNASIKESIWSRYCRLFFLVLPVMVFTLDVFLFLMFSRQYYMQGDVWSGIAAASFVLFSVQISKHVW